MDGRGTLDPPDLLEGGGIAKDERIARAKVSKGYSVQNMLAVAPKS